MHSTHLYTVGLWVPEAWAVSAGGDHDDKGILNAECFCLPCWCTGTSERGILELGRRGQGKEVRQADIPAGHLLCSPGCRSCTSGLWGFRFSGSCGVSFLLHVLLSCMWNTGGAVASLSFLCSGESPPATSEDHSSWAAKDARFNPQYGG